MQMDKYEGNLKQYRKKPVVIEAMQFDGSKGVAQDILDWAGPKCGMEMRYTSLLKHPCILVIQTLEGEMRALKSDFIIKGVKGEFNPCKEGIFEATYEEL